MQRFIVTRQYIKYKGTLYKKGELLPPEFTERDRCRNIYPSRIGTTEVPDSEEKAEDIDMLKTPITGTTSAKGVTSARKPLSSVNKNTGTKSVPVTRAISSK